MPLPTPDARAFLDSYMQDLASLGDGLTIDDFRTAQILNAARTALRVRGYILVFSIFFMGLALWALYLSQSDPTGTAEGCKARAYSIYIAALWALALGGLGAVASIFINVLKLIPEQTLKTSDEFEVFGRIILGCLFSTILATTLSAADLIGFFDQLGKREIPKSGILLLVPFLAGYSITLVLNLLEKAIQAVELAIGLDDRRAIGAGVPPNQATQRSGRRGRAN